jgi:DNA-binding response OmpR family regulator
MREVKILLVEGRSAGSESWAPWVLKEGLDIRVVHTGRSALETGGAYDPHLVIFDGASMRSTGVRSCRRLRRELGETPIILTRGEGEDLDESAEADIYLQAPFTARKLLNRIRILLPADETEEQIVRCGTLTLFLGKRSVEVSGQGEQRLTPKQSRLLEEFLRHPNIVVSRLQLMQNVWETEYVGDTRTLDVHIRWLREIIEADPSNPQLLQTVRGQGYIYRCTPLGEE